MPRSSSTPRSVALDVLRDAFAGAHAAPRLDAALKRARLDGRDAGLATVLVYGTLRHAHTLNMALTPLLRGKTPARSRVLLLAGAFEKLILGTPPHAVLNEYVGLARGATLAPPGLVNAVLRKIKLPGPTPEAQASMEPWLLRAFGEAYGDQAKAVTASLLEPQPLWLWTGEGGRAALEAEGHTVRREVGGCLEVGLSAPLGSSAAYREGLVQPINPASLACVHALGAVAGEAVLDLAGGSGVKAAMLAARGARVTSVDIAERKHGLARANFARLGLSGEFVGHDLSAPLPLPPATHVLLDAPCTGSGTLRAHPEIKLRLTSEAVQGAAALQATMLRQAAAAVAPGGALLYAVCSVFPEEGARAVEDFLAEHPAFAPEGFEATVPATAQGPGMLTLNTDGLDGFFIARLRRRP